MQVFEGQQHVIDSRKPIPLWHKTQTMTQIASGLGHTHAHGFIHCDVKRANLMLLPDGRGAVIARLPT